jgi:hypothetical protein
MGALLTIVGVPGTANAGQPLNIGLQPALQPLTFTDIVLEILSLDFMAKQDVFTNKDFTQPGFVEDPASYENPSALQPGRSPSESGSGQSVAGVSTKLAYRNPRIFAEHTNEVFGLNPSRVRSHMSED